LWRKNPENLTEKENKRLDQIDQESLLTAKAYQMKLELQKIYQVQDAREAARRLRIWCWWVERTARRQSPSILKPMVSVARMIKRHFKGVVAHWKSGLTNAYMEGLNSVFQATKRKARGFRSSVYLITVLYLIAGKLSLPAR
jgi:transposase